MNTQEMGLLDAIRFHNSNDLEAAIKRYADLGMEEYRRLAISHSALEKECLQRAFVANRSVTQNLYDYLTENSLNSTSDPFAVILLVLSAGIYFEFSYSKNYVAIAFRRVRDFNSELHPLLFAWCHYIRAVVLMREYSAISELDRHIGRNYVFSIDGRNGLLVHSYAASLKSAAVSSLDMAESYVPFSSPALSSGLRQLRMAIENLEGNFARAVSRVDEIKYCSLNELHGILSGATRGGASPDILRAICSEAAERIGGDLIFRVLENIYRHSQSISVYHRADILQAGTLIARTELVRAGAIVLRDDRRRYEGITLYALCDATILDVRGHIACGNHLLMPSCTFCSQDFDKDCSELEGLWQQMRVAGYAPVFQGTEYTVVAHGPISGTINAGAEIILIPDSFPSLANYAHWLLDVVPRIISVISYVQQGSKLLFLQNLSQLQFDTLESLGIGKSDIYIATIEGFPLKISQALVPLPYFTSSTVDGDLLVSHPGSLLQLRDMFFQKLDSGTVARRHVYISRAKRRPKNESDYIPILQNHGFEHIDHLAMSFSEQRDLFHGTKILVSPGGAGLANMIFMKPGSTVLAIYEEHFNSPMYSYLAAVIGVRYITLVGKLTGQFATRAGEQGFSVDLDDLQIALKLAFDLGDNTAG